MNSLLSFVAELPQFSLMVCSQGRYLKGLLEEFIWYKFEIENCQQYIFFILFMRIDYHKCSKDSLMNIQAFFRLTESLKQYRRAELKDFEEELGGAPVDTLYVDPLPGSAVINTVLSSNTTMILGRKGTGKSTIFAKAQSEFRRKEKSISLYIDVKSLSGLMGNDEIPASSLTEIQINEELLHTHLLKKSLLNKVLAEIVTELRKSCEKRRFFERWLGKNKKYDDAIKSLNNLSEKISSGFLTKSLIPILQNIEKNSTIKDSQKETSKVSATAHFELSPTSGRGKFNSSASALEESLNDSICYSAYTEAIVQSFPYSELIEEIKDVLSELSMERIIIFFDDFSELSWINQCLFVDTILAPLNNSSDEKIKLKIAAYPGRVYWGSIDPGKIEIIKLDFYDLYKSSSVQEIEQRSIDYTTRLLQHRFNSFKIRIEDFFDDTVEIEEHMRAIFESTFNVPRMIGCILSYCYKDRISQNKKITLSNIRLSAQKYYEDVLQPYFENKNKFALEPYSTKLDRHNQQILLNKLISEAKNVRRGIMKREIGGSYFTSIGNPPASHFTVFKTLEPMLASLELNFLLTKYHEMRDKSGIDVSVYALNYGLTESEHIPWGYPKGRRDDRSYFVQRCFSYSTVVHQFLAQTQTIRCNECGQSFPMDKKDAISLYNWDCPSCKVGKCSIVSLATDYISDLEKLDQSAMLEEVEFDILDILNREGRTMRAGEISKLIDTTYQLVGKRTEKLKDSALVQKQLIDGVAQSAITERAQAIYFSKK